MTPRIAIPLPTSTDHAYNRLNFPAYADAVRACAGEPVEFALDLSRSEAARLSSSCQAILLPGSPADVDPADYGQARDQATAPADPAREAIDWLLLEDAWLLRKPVLGICFGIQSLNVFRAGTLIQDIAVMPVNHAAGRSVAIAHTVSVAAGSLLASVVDANEAAVVDGYLRLPVNSSHHQAVGIAGFDLCVTARCPQDAVVEAVEGAYSADDEARHFVLGVQWHPERTFHSSATSRAIFSRLVEEAVSWRQAAAGSVLSVSG